MSSPLRKTIRTPYAGSTHLAKVSWHYVRTGGKRTIEDRNTEHEGRSRREDVVGACYQRRVRVQASSTRSTRFTLRRRAHRLLAAAAMTT
jgi:hypothetical protein